MPKPHFISFNINLVPKDPFFKTPIGKVLRWALSVGRYIVIFTELIVIVSFVARFSLDRQVTDLNNSINQKSIIIQSYGELEPQVRQAQIALEQYQQVEQRTNIIDIFPELSRITPQEVKLNDLTIRPGSISLSGNTTSQTGLNLLINNIQLSNKFKNVSVDRIETADKKEGGFSFIIQAETDQFAVEAQNTNKRSQEKVNVLDRTQGL